MAPSLTTHHQVFPSLAEVLPNLARVLPTQNTLGGWLCCIGWVGLRWQPTHRDSICLLSAAPCIHFLVHCLLHYPTWCRMPVFKETKNELRGERTIWGDMVDKQFWKAFKARRKQVHTFHVFFMFVHYTCYTRRGNVGWGITWQHRFSWYACMIAVASNYQATTTTTRSLAVRCGMFHLLIRCVAWEWDMGFLSD